MSCSNGETFSGTQSYIALHAEEPGGVACSDCDDGHIVEDRYIY